MGTTDIGDVGLFVGLRRLAHNGEPQLQFYRVSFAAQGRKVQPANEMGQWNQGSTRLYYSFGTPLEWSRAGHSELGTTHLFDLISSPEKPISWHHQEVVVSPAGIQTWWRTPEGQDVPAQNVTVDTILSNLKIDAGLLPLFKHAPPDIAVRGGLGIYANRSTISVRNLVVTPLR